MVRKKESPPKKHLLNAELRMALCEISRNATTFCIFQTGKDPPTPTLHTHTDQQREEIVNTV